MTILACTFRLRDARVQEAGVSEVTVHFEQKFLRHEKTLKSILD